ITINLSPSPDIAFRGDEDLLRRMMLNLLDNAIKYTSPEGMVSVNLQVDTGSVKIAVADTGSGIPAEAAQRIFERFYRVSQSRSRADGGSGLGLAIAKWAAEAHYGTIRLTSEAGLGSTFTVTLPR